MIPKTKPTACVGCPAYEWGVGFVPALEPKTEPIIAAIGQGPSEMEARYSEPFLPTAPAGSMMTEWVHLAGLQRSEILIGNLVSCWLPESKVKGFPRGNRPPTDTEANECYRRHLHPLLVKHGFDQPHKWVFAVGAPAAKFLLGDPKVERLLGTANQRDLPDVK